MRNSDHYTVTRKPPVMQNAAPFANRFFRRGITAARQLRKLLAWDARTAVGSPRDTVASYAIIGHIGSLPVTGLRCGGNTLKNLLVETQDNYILRRVTCLDVVNPVQIGTDPLGPFSGCHIRAKK